MVRKTTPPRARRLRGGGLGAAAGLVLALAGLVVGVPAQAHDQLIGADPGIGATVQKAPEKVSLRFSADVTPVGNEIRVTDSHGRTVSNGDVAVEGNTVSEKISPDAGDETYTVVWRVVSSDGHPVQGTFDFLVGQGGSGKQSALPSQGAHEDDEHGSDSGSTAAPQETAGTTAAEHQETGGTTGMPLWLVGLVGAFVALVVLGLIALFVARGRDRRNPPGGRGTRGQE